MLNCILWALDYFNIEKVIPFIRFTQDSLEFISIMSTVLRVYFNWIQGLDGIVQLITYELVEICKKRIKGKVFLEKDESKRENFNTVHLSKWQRMFLSTSNKVMNAKVCWILGQCRKVILINWIVPMRITGFMCICEV